MLEFARSFKANGWVISIVLIILFIADILSKGNVLYKAGKGIKSMTQKFKKWVSKIRKLDYEQKLQNRNYLRWQKEILKRIYENEVNSFNLNNNNIRCEWTNPFKNCNTINASKKLIGIKDDPMTFFEALLFKAPSNCSYTYPFPSLIDKTEIHYRKPESFNYKPKEKEVISYYKKIKHTIPFPNNIGYMLDSINLGTKENDSVADPSPLFHMKFNVGTYIENVCESHYLENELIQLYRRKYKDKGSISANESAETLLKELPHRNAIHNKIKSNGESVLTSGAGRSSLASVSMMVVCKNANGKYDVLQIRRSDVVDAKVGFIQFIPSGGFSALSSSNGYDTQFSNVSIVKSVFRELLEECFGEEDYSGKKEISTEMIYNHPIIKKLHKLFANEASETKMYFLGTALRLVDLRHDVCFLLVIDDEEIISQIKPNEECNNVINFISIDRLQDLRYWAHYGKNDDEEDEDDFNMLNDTSATLWQLAQESENEYIKKLFSSQEIVEL